MSLLDSIDAAQASRASSLSPNPMGQASLIVGVGASAGGLEPLTALVKALPRGSGIAVIVVQHQSPKFRSLLVPLLSQDAHLEVCEITQGLALRPDTIFVAPSGSNVLLRGQQFSLQPNAGEGLGRPSIDIFLSSLASFRDAAAAVILSGSGSDGAAGALDVKTAGGVVLVQNPATAAFASMPRAALEKGCVDQALEPEEIAQILVQLACALREQLPPQVPAGDETLLQQLFVKIQRHTLTDLSGYRQTTLWRRLHRRLAATRQNSLEAYLRHVDEHPEELDAMAHEILVSVTGFFRDASAFEAFGVALAPLVDARKRDQMLRVWVAGCATGEEAYTVAMQLMELLGPDRFSEETIRIFATDVDVPALSLARLGRYSVASAAALPPQLRERYLTPCAEGFEVIPAIRSWVRFARHDLAQDPPFLRVDVICCRNVLIYFQTELRNRILQAMHFALKPDGLLFLGQSESLQQPDGLFLTLDQEARVYRRSPVAPRLPGGFQLRTRPIESGAKVVDRTPAEQLREYFRTGTGHYVPPSVLLNSRLELQYVHGDITPFTRLSAGAPGRQFVELVIPEFQVELRVLLHQAGQSQKAILGRTRVIGKSKGHGKQNRYRLAIFPELIAQEVWFIVAFESRPAAARTRTENGEESRESGSGRELATSQAHLLNAMDLLGQNDHEIEVLAAALQASNEELQTSNGELQTSNEELQSATEELSTVNEELQVRTMELADSVGDLESVHNSLGIPLIVMGRGFSLHRYNRAAAELLGLTLHRPVKRIDPAQLPEPMKRLDEWVEGVIATSLPRLLQVELHNRRYVLQIRPYDSATRHTSLAVLVFVDQTELLVAEAQLAENNQQLQATLNNSPAIVALKDPAGRYHYVNPRFTQFFRMTMEHCLGKTDAQLFPIELADALRAADLEMMRHSAPREVEHAVYLPSGSYQLLAVRFPLIGDDGAISLLCFQATDITARKHLERDLRVAATVFEQSPSAILIADAQRVTVSVNPSFSRITGQSAETLMGREPLSSLVEDEAFDPLIWAEVHDRGVWHGELSCRRPNGERFSAWVDIALTRSSDGKPLNHVITLDDLSPLQDTRQRVEFLATHDALTELPNRRLFADRLDHAIKRCARQRTRMAVVFIDLDHFKYVNDTFGHEFGDVLLQQCSALFRQTVRDMDTVARLGGDEFAMLFERIGDDDAELACNRLLEAFAAPILVLGESIQVGLSLGVTVCPDDGETPSELMRNADAAMYRAKALGRNDYHFYSAEMRADLARRRSLDRDLRLALASNELSMVYQPQIRFDTGNCVGVEALLRWRHSTRGDVSPKEFIGIAEESKLIDDVTLWVLQTVVTQIRDWQRAGTVAPTVSVNISPRNFRRMDLAAIMAKLAAVAGISPSCLSFEITETVLMDSHLSVSERVKDLVKLGVKLSLDDFGTGYSSISALAELPIHELKLDPAFTQRVTGGPSGRSLALAILMLAQAHNLQIIAEGIETEEQAQALAAMGFEAGQGILYSPGVSGAELPDVLKGLLR